MSTACTLKTVSLPQQHIFMSGLGRQRSKLFSKWQHSGEQMLPHTEQIKVFKITHGSVWIISWWQQACEKVRKRKELQSIYGSNEKVNICNYVTLNSKTIWFPALLNILLSFSIRKQPTFYAQFQSSIKYLPILQKVFLKSCFRPSAQFIFPCMFLIF